MDFNLQFLNDSIFHDGTEEFRKPMVPKKHGDLKVILRVGKDAVEKASVIVNGFEIDMKKSEKQDIDLRTDYFDFYEVCFKTGECTVDYYFKVVCPGVTGFYDVLGFSTEHDDEFNFKVTPGYTTPDWAKGAVMYQIYVDRFYNGDKSNDVVDHEYEYCGDHVNFVKDWDKVPASFGVREFYGGDLQGVIDKMDYLKKLGVEVIYLNPVFVSPSNHKYDTQDYDYIDPHFGKIIYDEGEVLSPGDHDNKHASRYINRVSNKENLEASNEMFATLVSQAHSRGMKVIIDGVFNHCGSFNKWMDKELIYGHEPGYELGAFESVNSPYREFFRFENDENFSNQYEGWWGYDTLPKLNYEGSKELYDYIMHIAAKWVSAPYNADGWRLDVAADLGHSPEMNHRFWKDFRDAVKGANPEAIILAEHYGDPHYWLQGGEWDTIMNYDAFMEPVTWFLTGVEKHSDETNMSIKSDSQWFVNSMKHNMAKMQTQSMLVSMNELSNHDHSRFLTRTNGRAGRTATEGPEAASQGIDMAIMYEAIIMQMTWPGAPTVYYGDEAGVCGWTDPDNRRTYPWGHENLELMELYRYMIHVHRHNHALKTGALKILGYRDGMVMYGRFESGSVVVTAVNNSDVDMDIDIPVWQLGIKDEDIMERLLEMNGTRYNIGKVDVPVENGYIHATIHGKGGLVYRRKLK